MEKSYITKNGEEVYVGIDDINYKNNNPKIRNYVVKNQADLVLQKEFYESGKLKSVGYYRLIYDTKNENYRWFRIYFGLIMTKTKSLKNKLFFVMELLLKNDRSGSLLCPAPHNKSYTDRTV